MFPEKKEATYEDLYNIPENMTGEIIDGELFVSPRPSRRHTLTATALSGEITPAYYFGRGGPGGWIILVEPEIQLGKHTLVPDLAGWKKERFLWEEEQNPISVVPDWVCEILSPVTFRLDRVKKMSLYAEFRIGHLWMIDPEETTLEIYRLETDKWLWLGTYDGAQSSRGTVSGNRNRSRRLVAGVFLCTIWRTDGQNKRATALDPRSFA